MVLSKNSKYPKYIRDLIIRKRTCENEDNEGSPTPLSARSDVDDDGGDDDGGDDDGGTENGEDDGGGIGGGENEDNEGSPTPLSEVRC